MRFLNALAAASTSFELIYAVAINPPATTVPDIKAINYTDPLNGWSFSSPGCLIPNGANDSSPSSNLIARAPRTFEEIVNIGIAKVVNQYSRTPPKLLSVIVRPQQEMTDPNRDSFKIRILFGWSDGFVEILTKPGDWQEWGDPEFTRTSLLPPPDHWRPFDFSQVKMTFAQALQLVKDAGFGGPFRFIQIQRPRQGQHHPVDQIFFVFALTSPDFYDVAVSSETKEPVPFSDSLPPILGDDEIDISESLNNTARLLLERDNALTSSDSGVVATPSSTALANVPSGFELIVNDGIVLANSRFYNPFPKLCHVEATPSSEFRDPDKDWEKIILRFTWQDVVVLIVRTNHGWLNPSVTSTKDDIKNLAPFDYLDIKLSAARAVGLVSGAFFRHFDRMHIVRPPAPYRRGGDQRYYLFWSSPRNVGIGDIEQIPFWVPHMTSTMENDTDLDAGLLPSLSHEQISNATVQSSNNILSARAVPDTFEQNLLIGIELMNTFYKDPPPHLFLITAVPKPAFSHINHDWELIVMSFVRGNQVIQLRSANVWGQWQLPIVFSQPKSSSLVVFNLSQLRLTVVYAINTILIATSSPVLFDEMSISQPAPERQGGGTQRIFGFAYSRRVPGRVTGTYVLTDVSKEIIFYPDPVDPPLGTADLSERCDMR